MTNAKAIELTAAVVASIGTVTAICISLYLAWHNRHQFKMTTRIGILSTLIKEAEDRTVELDKAIPSGGWTTTPDIEKLEEFLEHLKDSAPKEDILITQEVVRESAAEIITNKTRHDNMIKKWQNMIEAVEYLIDLRKEFYYLAEKTRTKIK